MGAYVTADARSQHVAQQPAAQGHSSIPLLGFSPPTTTTPKAAAVSSVNTRQSVGLLPLHDATGTRISAGAEAPPVGRGLHVRLSAGRGRLLPRIKRRNVHRFCKRFKHQLGNVLLANQQHDREKQTNTKVRTFPTGQTTQRCSKHPPKKILKRLRRPDIKNGTVWKSSPTCLSASTGRVVSEIHSCSGRFLPVQPRIWGFFFFFGLWKKSFSSKLHAMRGERKKRKKLTEQEMMTQLYGNHFRTRTRNSEPGTSGTHEEVSMEFSSFQSCLIPKKGKIKLAIVANYLKTSGRRNQVYYVKFISKLQFYIYNT